MIRVSVVVTTVDDDGGRLPACLMHWLPLLSLHSHAELIVVNDGGPNGYGSVTKAAASGQRIKLLYLGPPDPAFRLAQARNMGIKHSQATERIVFTDSDCIPGREFIPMHSALGSMPHIGVGFRKRIKGELTRHWQADPNTVPNEDQLDAMTWRDDERFDEHKPPGWRGCEHVWGCNFSVPVEPLVNCGGFDESIQGWGGEDINLADRLMRGAGLTLSILDGCYVYHMDHPQRSERSPHPFGQRGQPLVANGGPLGRTYA
jgi:glycosyltransferase involved in cell wall biosynthesis